jgi:hypothetical protein
MAYAAAGWTAPSTIAQLVARENSLDVILSSSNNPMSCTSQNWYRLPTSAANYQVIAANIMAAKAQGKNVDVWAYACDTDGASLILGAWVTD